MPTRKLRSGSPGSSHPYAGKSSANIQLSTRSANRAAKTVKGSSRKKSSKVEDDTGLS